MKIILSRKGFDSSNGGCASPILPDGTMLSMPIPSEDNIEYNDLIYNNTSYADILKQINPNGSYNKKCHLDPDIRPNIRKTPVENWQAAFGQIGSAQSALHNAGVSVGDIFLFFGWFHKTLFEDNKLKYCCAERGNNTDFYENSDLQVIYGYMQIGEIITDKEKIKQYFWHPHASKERLIKKNNAIYVPSEKLTSLNSDLPGYGVLNYRKDRVLTKEGRTRAVWDEREFLMPDRIYGNRKNSAKNGELYYKGIWQELIVDESPELLEWVRGVIE